MIDNKTLRQCENLLKVSNETKEYEKIRLLNLIDDTEQFFPMGATIK